MHLQCQSSIFPIFFVIQNVIVGCLTRSLRCFQSTGIHSKSQINERQVDLFPPSRIIYPVVVKSDPSTHVQLFANGRPGWWYKILSVVVMTGWHTYAVYRSATVPQWWLPVHLDEFRFQVWLMLPLPARFITGSGSPAVNNLYEYSRSRLPPGRRCVCTLCGWTNCLSCSPAVKPVVGPFMTDDCLICVVILPSDRRLSLGYRHSVRWPNSRFSRRGRSSATGCIFCGGAVSKCRFRLRWHLGPKWREGIFLASARLCSFCY